MKFEEALKAMREGKKVRCINDNDYICYYLDKDYDKYPYFRAENTITGNRWTRTTGFKPRQVLTGIWEIVDD